MAVPPQFSANLSEIVGQSRMQHENDEMFAVVARFPRKTSLSCLSFTAMKSRTCHGCDGSHALEVRMRHDTRGSGANTTKQLAVAMRP